MNIRSLRTGGLPAACLSSRRTGSISDHTASEMRRRKAMIVLRKKSIDGEPINISRIRQHGLVQDGWDTYSYDGVGGSGHAVTFLYHHPTMTLNNPMMTTALARR